LWFDPNSKIYLWKGFRVMLPRKNDSPADRHASRPFGNDKETAERTRRESKAESPTTWNSFRSKQGRGVTVDDYTLHISAGEPALGFSSA